MTTPASDTPLQLGHQLCFAVYSAGHAFNRAYKPLLDPLGLTYPQYLVMLVLWEQDDRTVGQIGDRLLLDSSTLTPLLKRLEAAGHISRVRDPEDERQVRVRLTPSGGALRERAAGVPLAMAVATGQSSAEIQQLKAQIIALRDALALAEAGSAPG
jgi:DNA-binding MarR family transcriptional regulator